MINNKDTEQQYRQAVDELFDKIMFGYKMIERACAEQKITDRTLMAKIYSSVLTSFKYEDDNNGGKIVEPKEEDIIDNLRSSNIIQSNVSCYSLTTAIQNIILKQKNDLMKMYLFFSDFLKLPSAIDYIIGRVDIKISNGVRFFVFPVPIEVRLPLKIVISALVQRLVAKHGTKITRAKENAILDIGEEGYRFNILDSSLTINGGNVLAIRRDTTDESAGNRQHELIGLDKMTKDKKQLEKIKKIVPKIVTHNYIIFGETGSGKTTLLKWLLLNNQAPKENIVSIEDTSELKLPTSTAFITNKNIGIGDLFTASLRQNPDRVVVGETRTKQIIDILKMGLTGKFATTFHSSSLHKCLYRMVVLGLELKELSAQEIEKLITESVEYLIRMDGGRIQEVWFYDRKKQEWQNYLDE